MKHEKTFQANLIKRLKHMFPGCIILKNDSGYLQGIPDLLILYKKKWAVLECKRCLRSSYQPNQEYYLNELNNMSFAMTICPENEEEILDELQQTFKPRRTTRVSEC